MILEIYFTRCESNYVVSSDFSDVIRIQIRFHKLGCSVCIKHVKRGIILTTSLWQELSASMEFIPPAELNEMTIIKQSLALFTKRFNNVRFISIQRIFQKSSLFHEFVPCIC